MNNDLFKERAFLAGTLSFIFSLLSTIILLLLVKTFFLGNANTQPDLSLLNATGAALAAPEPIERTLFFAGFFSLPIFLFVFFWAFDQLIAHNRILHVKTAVSAALGGMGIFLSYSLFTYFSRYASLLGHAKYSRSFPVIVTGGIVGLTVGAIAAWFVARQILRANAVSGSRLNVFWGAIAGLFILLSFLMSLFGMGAITEHPIFTNHFNAVFQAVVQVVNGKAVLLNFPHQYGLYPHFIEPIFHLFGLSVFKFTVLMGLLMAIGELAVLACLNRLVQNPLISKMGFVAAIFFSAYLVKSFSATHDFYFHYFPLRFIFPALAMYFMLRYFEDNSWTKSLFGFLLVSL